MNKIIKTLFIIILLGGIFFIGYKISFWRQSPNIPSSTIEDLKTINNRQDYPFIENGYLYTELKTIAIRDIKRIDLEETSVRYIIIIWQSDKYRGGMFTMSLTDFKKIEKDLGVRYVQR
jgi:hypothetical protein